MEQLNIISGNGDASTHIINDLIDSAYKYYGDKYKSIILDTVRESIFYEKEKNEDPKKIIDGFCYELDKHDFKKFVACNLSVRYPSMDGYYKKNYIIWKPTNTDLDYHILAHEVFGHGVCERKKTYVTNGIKTYKRNGINLVDIRGNEYYTLINEGFMETIVDGILEMKGDIRKTLSNDYELAKKCGKYIFNLIGKDKMLDFLVNFDHSIDRLDMKQLDKLEKLLEKANKQKIDKYESKIEKRLLKIKEKAIQR